MGGAAAMPDWIRDVLRVVCLFTCPLTAIAAAIWTLTISLFGELPHPSQIAVAYGLWTLSGTLLIAIWILRPRRRSSD
jgi:hypothetical protein